MMDSMLIIRVNSVTQAIPRQAGKSAEPDDENGEPMGYYERNRGWWYPRETAFYPPQGSAVWLKALRLLKIPTAAIRCRQKSIPVVETCACCLVERKRGGSWWNNRSVITANVKTWLQDSKLAKTRTVGLALRTIGKSWTTQLTSGDDFIQGEVGTPVSYADYVQGCKVPQFHKDRGWEHARTFETRIPQIDARLEQTQRLPCEIWRTVMNGFSAAFYNASKSWHVSQTAGVGTAAIEQQIVRVKSWTMKSRYLTFELVA